MPVNILGQPGRMIRTMDIPKALSILAALGVPLVVFHGADLSLAISMIMGVFLGAPADIPGSRKHMILGILTGISSGTFTYLVLSLATLAGSFWLVPLLAFFCFFHAMIAVYGFRASLVSFSGLIAIIFSMARPATYFETAFQNAGLMLSGGLVYLCVAWISNRLTDKRVKRKLLAESLLLTATFIRKRTHMIEAGEETTALQQELISLQQELNEKHEKLREILVAERKAGITTDFSGKQILIFVELIDILELILANPANYERIRHEFEGREFLITPFVDTLIYIAAQLEEAAKVLAEGKKPGEQTDAERVLKPVRETMQSAEIEQLPESLRNLLTYMTGYLRKQLDKVRVIEKVLRDLVDKETVRSRTGDAERFVTETQYAPAILLGNLNFRSPVFRHALRLSIAVTLAYVAGLFIQIQNSYWIVMTIIVILRPGYALTKERSAHRVIGTVIGAAIAFVVILLTGNKTLFGTLSVICLVLAFSFIQRNYRSAAMFITLNVIFLYALLADNVWHVISFRVLDTLIGTLIAFLASRFLFPMWESDSIRDLFFDSMRASSEYLRQVIRSCGESEKPLNYKLARKEAFLELGRLNAAGERLNHDPLSHQDDPEKIARLILMDHNLLSAIAALGTYLDAHKHKCSTALIDSCGKAVLHNLELIGKTETTIPVELQRPENLDPGTESYLFSQLFWLNELSLKINAELGSSQNQYATKQHSTL